MTSFVYNETFSEADHQLIGMKLSYQAEKKVRNKIIEDLNDLNEVKRKMLNVYRKHLDNKTIKLVENLPQFTKDRVPIKTGYMVETAGQSEFERETGFHVNAITKGDPENPKEVTVVFPGTNFKDALDVGQTGKSQRKRADDYSERAIKYIGKVKEKYPNVNIVVDRKIAIKIGFIYPDVPVYPFNPTNKLIKKGKYCDYLSMKGVPYYLKWC